MIAPITTNRLGRLGTDLARPECVLGTEAGQVYVSDSRGGIVVISPDGTQTLRSASGPEVPPSFLPNGFALCADGSLLIANLGPEGGVFRMAPDGETTAYLMDVDGRALPGTNFVNLDPTGRVWISVSTWQIPREKSFNRDIYDGFIILVDDSGARIVADDLGFANENKMHPSGEWLYVNETIARRLSRYPVSNNGDLGRRETVIEFGDGIFPDGFEFDEEGGIWIASVVSNRLARIDRNGAVSIIIDDADVDALADAENAWNANDFQRKHIDAGRLGSLGNLASITFIGKDRKTAVMGSLFGDHIATFQSPIAGVVPTHWHY